MKPKSEQELREDVVTAALAWWGAQRPHTWLEATHLKFPEANLCKQCEYELARAIATLVNIVGGTESEYEKSVNRAKGSRGTGA